MNILKQLFWVLVILNVLDVVITYTILGLGGYEANPLMNIFIQQFGILAGLVIMKAIPITMLYYIIECRVNDITKTMIALMWVPIVAYAVLIVYSSTLLIRMLS